MSGVISAGTAALSGVVGETLAAGITDALVGSALGAGVSAITGGNIGQGALMGGLTGGVGSLAGSALSGAGAGLGGIGSALSDATGISSLGDIFGGATGSDAANGAASGVNWNTPGLTSAAQGAASVAPDGAPISWNNNLTAPGSSGSTVGNLVNKLVGSGGSGGSSSGLLGSNPLATLGTLANTGNNIMTSQANQDALKEQQARQAQLNSNISGALSNFTPLNRQAVAPSTVGNLNNYGQAGYQGWNGQGGNQLFYNNVNPASYNVPGMKAGGKVNYQTGGNVDPKQQLISNITQSMMAPQAGPQPQSPKSNPMHDSGPSLASILQNMKEQSQMLPDPRSMTNNPMTYNLASQIYPQAQQIDKIQTALSTGQPYAKGGLAKKSKALQISKTTQLTIPQGLQAQPGMQALPQGVPQGLAGGGLPRIMGHPQHPMGMPMQSMPNRISPNITGMTPNRMNPNNPNMNMSPLRMMASGGHLNGSADGQADTIDAKLSDGEYVLSSDVVSALGSGNNNAGAKKLDQMVKNIRIHGNVNPPNVKGAKGKLPPKAKPIVEYMGKRRVKKS